MAMSDEQYKKIVAELKETKAHQGSGRHDAFAHYLVMSSVEGLIGRGKLAQAITLPKPDGAAPPVFAVERAEGLRGRVENMADVPASLVRIVNDAVNRLGPPLEPYVPGSGKLESQLKPDSYWRAIIEIETAISMAERGL